MTTLLYWYTTGITRCTVAAAISNQQSGAGVTPNRESQYIRWVQFDSTEMHEIAITRLKFGETEMCEVHLNHMRAARNRMSHFDGHYEFGSDDTTNIPNLRSRRANLPASSVDP